MTEFRWKNRTPILSDGKTELRFCPKRKQNSDSVLRENRTPILSDGMAEFRWDDRTPILS